MPFTATNVAVTAAVINSNNASMVAAQQESDLISNCKNYIIPDFDNQIATVEQKQQYATCIQHVYPEESGERFGKEFCQTTLVWIALSMLVGCYFYYKEKDFVNFLFGTFFGMCGSLGIGLVIALLYGAFS